MGLLYAKYPQQPITLVDSSISYAKNPHFKKLPLIFKTFTTLSVYTV
jgi:hypothetical protein